MKPDISDLIRRMAEAETEFAKTKFIAPCVPGGRLRVRVAGIVTELLPKPRTFFGFGVFQAVPNSKEAQLVREATLAEREKYLALLPSLQVRLIRVLEKDLWLAYPVNEADAGQRLAGGARPVLVWLVEGVGAFEAVMVRQAAGNFWWFEGVDRRADPIHADKMREALNAKTPVTGLQFPGMTPEARTCYGLALNPQFDYRNLPQTDAQRLERALHTGGGTLHGFVEYPEYFQVEWATRAGERHTSAIAKDSLTVLSSGICLSGEDEKFDLTSLVGVMEKREEDW